MAKDLCEFEVSVLKVCAGMPVPGLDWGAAMGQALEFLKGSGLVQCSSAGIYSVTDAGRQELDRYQRPASATEGMRYQLPASASEQGCAR